jgi:hypothetical protein
MLHQADVGLRTFIVALVRSAWWVWCAVWVVSGEPSVVSSVSRMVREADARLRDALL